MNTIGNYQPSARAISSLEDLIKSGWSEKEGIITSPDGRKVALVNRDGNVFHQDREIVEYSGEDYISAIGRVKECVRQLKQRRAFAVPASAMGQLSLRPPHQGAPSVGASSAGASSAGASSSLASGGMLFSHENFNVILAEDIFAHAAAMKQDHIMVNAANGNLEHTGGLAGAMAQKAGPRLQRESHQITKTMGKLIDGQVVETGAYNLAHLKTQSVLHAVGPRYDAYKGNPKKIKDILKVAYTTIINQYTPGCPVYSPLLSVGIFSVPAKWSAEAFFEAYKEYVEARPGRPKPVVHVVMSSKYDDPQIIQNVQSHLQHLQQSTSVPAATASPPSRVSCTKTSAPQGFAGLSSTSATSGFSAHAEKAGAKAGASEHPASDKPVRRGSRLKYLLAEMRQSQSLSSGARPERASTQGAGSQFNGDSASARSPALLNTDGNPIRDAQAILGDLLRDGHLRCLTQKEIGRLSDNYVSIYTLEPLKTLKEGAVVVYKHGAEKQERPVAVEDLIGSLKEKATGNAFKHPGESSAQFKLDGNNVARLAVGEPVKGPCPDGTMKITREHGKLGGDNSNRLIKIVYNIPGKPGQFTGGQRTAYLPDTPEGINFKNLLKFTFALRQTFTVGTSRTSGVENTITWNDVHHKTNMTGGFANYGYPDADYISRTTDDLSSKAITPATMQQFKDYRDPGMIIDDET